ncbi:hypothetical protein [Mangrovibacter phragmitis]
MLADVREKSQRRESDSGGVVVEGIYGKVMIGLAVFSAYGNETQG